MRTAADRFGMFLKIYSILEFVWKKKFYRKISKIQSEKVCKKSDFFFKMCYFFLLMEITYRKKQNLVVIFFLVIILSLVSQSYLKPIDLIVLCLIDNELRRICNSFVGWHCGNGSICYLFANFLDTFSQKPVY